MLITSSKTFVIFLLATCCGMASSTSLNTLTPAAVNSTAVGNSTLSLPETFECPNMDIRNECENLAHLENCTVITGYMIIVLLSTNDTCDYSQYSFPKLREVTDFVLFSKVTNLTSFRDMFPNLTVIRGRKVFLNYALGISSMDSLERVEFPRLVAIQRGHVFIGSNPKLCFVNKINFNRLTLAPGENHIFPVTDVKCPAIDPCSGCNSGYCWSNMRCQKFENDNVVKMQEGIQHCDQQCLGGCDNHGCYVCRSWTDHGVCVDECPPDKYSSADYLRCYTREECIAKKLAIYKNTCVTSCPGGYFKNNITQECDSCTGVNNCIKVCHPRKDSNPFWIHTLEDVEYLNGCQICNGSIVINLRNRIDESELMKYLADIEEIVGHLKVYKSPYLTSLKFFRNLRKIHGKPLELQHYSLVIYKNKNLRELWPVRKGFELINGGISIQANDKLCNRVIRTYKNDVIHDRSLDSIQISDQEVLCAPAKLNLFVEVLSHRSIKFTWSKDETFEQVEIIYRPIDPNKPFNDDSELDTNVCERIFWQRDLKFTQDLDKNNTHYFYKIQNLAANTKYACLVKTFGQDDAAPAARSEIKFITTQVNVPPPPLIRITKKTSNSLTLQLSYENHEDQLVDFYMLEVYEIPENQHLLDQRDYCIDGVKQFSDYHNEDYDDCCSRRLEEAEDDLFKRQLEKEFSCSLDNKKYCTNNPLEDNYTNNANALLTKRLEHAETNYTIRSLERYQLYGIQVQACNRAGCGSFRIINERTNYSEAADRIYDLTACKMSHNNEYRVHFKEPKNPNGYITLYAIHFRYLNASTNGTYQGHMHCVTRSEHQRNNYLYQGYLNSTFNQAAVRVESFGHLTFTDWVAITNCNGVQMVYAKTKLAGRSSHGWNIFLVFFILGAAGTFLWVCYKRKYWRKIPQLRRYLPVYANLQSLRRDTSNDEDRQILVDGFETVRFHNSPDDDKKYLVH
ncbi:insulin receptor [Musca vetustissima]|uniref:insulin receptor n=1 Tax=Musca vetustissima TaxID=27455 RepID=UPI002AB6B02D|nr:insulin receptor [Musca vetustissima]